MTNGQYWSVLHVAQVPLPFRTTWSRVGWSWVAMGHTCCTVDCYSIGSTARPKDIGRRIDYVGPK